jgi:hypothetical protein
MRPKKAQVESVGGSAPRGDVSGWRREQLERAGFEPRLALLLAGTSIDLHALIGLVEHGCPPHLAARIMAPLETEETLC